MKVLIAEDEAVMRRLYEMVFHHEQDIEAVIVDKDWDKLPDCNGWWEIDVVLVDQYLESYRGSDLLEWLEANHPKIYRLMFTGDTSITRDQAHAHRVIYKPGDPSEIVAAVREGAADPGI